MSPIGLGLPRRLSALDNAFLAVESATAPMHVSCLAMYEIPAALGDRPTHLVMEIMRQAVRNVPVLRRTLLPSVPRVNRAYWSAPRDIDVADHIRTVQLRGRRDNDDLLAVAAGLHAHRLPRNRPLWEITVIRGLGGDGRGQERFAVLFKVHHAAVDGVTGMALFAMLHRGEPTEVEEATGAPVRPTPSMRRRLQDTWSDNLDVLAGPLRATVNLGRTLRTRGDDSSERVPFAVPSTELNQRVGPDRVAVTVAVSRDEVAAIRHAVPGATVNDVMLATIGGALRMLLTHGASTPTRDLVAGVPVARFGRGEIAEPGNDFDLLRIPLGINEAAPVRRLTTIQHASTRSKNAHRRGAVELNDVAALVPGWLLDAALKASPLVSRLGVPMPAVSTIISNVPGPRFPLYLGPAELVDLHALGPVANGLGVFHVITSYRDTVSIAVTSSATVLPDAPAYAELLLRSFDQLSAAAALTGGTIAT